jgi:uncharacterized membrane protein YhfC
MGVQVAVAECVDAIVVHVSEQGIEPGATAAAAAEGAKVGTSHVHPHERMLFNSKLLILQRHAASCVSIHALVYEAAREMQPMFMKIRCILQALFQHIASLQALHMPTIINSASAQIL